MKLFNLLLVFAFGGLLLTGCHREKREEKKDYVPHEQREANGVEVEVDNQ